MTYEPVLTPSVDMAPCPRVQVDFDTLHPDTATVTVYQRSDVDRTVMDAIRAFAAGGFTVTDYLPPLGVEISYDAVMFDVDGQTLGTTGATTVSLPWVDQSMAVFTDPLDPSTSALVEIVNDFAEKASRSRAQSLYQVGDRTVVLSGQNSLLQGVNLHSQVQTIDDTKALRNVLARPLTAVRSGPAAANIPRVFLTAIPSWDEVPVDVQWGGGWTKFEMSGDEISQGRVSIVVPVSTYQVYEDAFPTYGDFTAAYTSYLDAQKNPPDGATN